MWPGSKGKGQKGKDGSPKDGDLKKARATKAKLKAMTKEALEAEQEAAFRERAQEESAHSVNDLDDLDEKDEVDGDGSEPEVGLNYHQEQKEAEGGNFIRLPASAGEHSNEKVSGVWKNRVLGTGRPAAQDSQSQTGPRSVVDQNERIRQNAQHEAMVNLVDRMFDYFQNLAYDFNQMNPAPELELSWIRPTLTRENISSWHQSAQYISVFTGRISTRFWTLVVRGTYEAVDSYIIPADKLLSFTTAPSSHNCALSILPAFDGSRVFYYAHDHLLNEENLHLCYRALLDTLITVAQEDQPLRGALDLDALGVFGSVTHSSPTASASAPVGREAEMEIDYSALYRQHMAAQGQSQPQASAQKPFSQADERAPVSGEFYGGQGQSTPPQTYPSEFSTAAPAAAHAAPPVGQNVSGSQNSLQAQAQSPAAGSGRDDDDWKPVVRSVRSASQQMPINPFNTAAPAEPPKPAGSAGGEWRDLSSSGSRPAVDPNASGFNLQARPDAPRPGFSAQALFQSASAGMPQTPTPPQQPPGAPAAAFPQAPPAQAPAPSPRQEVPWNFVSSTSKTESAAAPVPQPGFQAPQPPAPSFQPQSFSRPPEPPAPTPMPHSRQVDEVAHLIAHENVPQVQSQPQPLVQPSVEPVRDILAADTETNPVLMRPAAPPAAASETSFKKALEVLLAAFDKEMESVAARGSEAFARRDLKGAEMMIKLAEEISQLKETIQQFTLANKDNLS
ncbi:MAG: hypothetical protein SFV17_06360 [Candidatus Obscuribacter sp.]|nr:hypothetical protein [Candidatus Obscuribacter sp.]